MEAVARGLEAGAVPQTARILLVAPPARGGLARHVVSLLAELHRDEYCMAVACDQDGMVAEAARERSIPVYTCRIGAGGNPSRAAVAALHVASAISHHQAQIIHTHSFEAGLVGALAMPLVGSVRMVATIHNYPPNATGMRAARAQHRWAARQVVRRASRIITVSDALRRDLLALYPDLGERTVTITNGVRIKTGEPRDPMQVRAEFGLAADSTLVGMIARFAPQKGVLEFIRACADVVERWTDVELVLAGDGPLRDAAESLREELGLQRKLHMIGEVESADALVGALDVVVIASLSEGSSIVAMEAMAAERPVVATEVGGVPEVVVHGETGILVRPGDPSALAAGIESLLGNRELARAMGERGRRRAAERFDIRLMFERTKQVYADLLRETMESGGGRA